jgi:hypothetical protein
MNTVITLNTNSPSSGRTYQCIHGIPAATRKPGLEHRRGVGQLLGRIRACTVKLYNQWPDANNRLVFHEYYNLENGIMGDNILLLPDTIDTDQYFCNQWGGLDCDGPVSGILWDIYDSQSDDQSTPGVTEPQPDGIGDTFSLGIQPLLRALLDRYVTGIGIVPHHPQTMQEFMYTWNMRDSSLGHTKALKDIFYEHGHTDCGFGMAGNVNNSASEMPSIGDVSMLVDSLYVSHGQLGCTKEADCNSDGSVSIGDIQLLIDYLFITYAPLAACKWCRLTRISIGDWSRRSGGQDVQKAIDSIECHVCDGSGVCLRTVSAEPLR